MARTVELGAVMLDLGTPVAPTTSRPALVILDPEQAQDP
jgi:hypothetical protein